MEKLTKGNFGYPGLEKEPGRLASIAGFDFDTACERLPGLAAGLNIANGEIVSQVVAKAFPKRSSRHSREG